MRIFRLTIPILLFGMVASVFARQWTPEDDFTTGIPAPNSVHITVEKLSPGHLHLLFDSIQTTNEQVTAGKRDWTSVSMPGETRRWEVGQPAVPIISRPILLPNTGNVSVKVLSSKYTEYHNINFLPQQPLAIEIKNGNSEQPFAIDNKSYATDNWYPAAVAEVGEPAILRDARTALLSVQPVQVNPATQTMRVYSSIELEITPIGGSGRNEILNSVQHSVPGFAHFYEDILGADELTEMNEVALPGSMLVICRDTSQIVNALTPYLDWRNRSGRPTTLVTTNATDLASIQAIITNAYNTFTPPLEYVQLVGDGGNSGPYLLPSYSFFDYNETSYADHEYVQLAGNDILADAFISRWSCDNVQQLATMVNRSLNYERNPSMADTNWYRRGWGYAGTVEATNRNVVWYTLSMMNARGVPWSGLFFDTHSHTVSSSLINSRCNPGLLFWADRPSIDGEITNADVIGITQNVNKCFVGMDITCATGLWYGAGVQGIHEQLTRNGSPSQPAGAICDMATQSYATHSAPNSCVMSGSYYALGVKNVQHPAEMYYEGKFQLWRNFEQFAADEVTDITYWNNAIGDIAVKMWTGVPLRMNANVPSQISMGQNRLEFVVTRQDGVTPVAGVMVTALKKNASGQTETYSQTVTDNSGQVVLTLSNSTVGSMYVTAIGARYDLNVLPISDTVTVVNSAVDLSLSGYQLWDSTSNGRIGNGDGLANPGETIDLNIRIVNRGTASSITNTNATLVSHNPLLIVSNATHTYPNIAAGDSAFASGMFRIQMLRGLRNSDIIPLQLNITSPDTTQNRMLTVSLPIHSIQLAFVNYALTPTHVDPGGSADLSVTVHNGGSLATGTITATLFTSSPEITITTNSATFTGLPIGQDASNPANQLFHFSVNQRLLSGTMVGFNVSFTAGAITDTVYFNVPVGTRVTTDPSGPDAYGYMAYDDSDTGYTLHPTFDWVNIETTANRLNVVDPALAQDTSVLIRLPFTARYYGVSYDTITVCTNGWISFGAARIYDSTLTPNPTHPESHLLTNARPWHLPSNEGPRNIVAVDWQDLFIGNSPQGVFTYNDSANGWYVVTWNGISSFDSLSNIVQVLIYNPARWATPSGDCMLKFQYKNYHSSYVTWEAGYAGIGIQDYSMTRALEYSYWNTFTPGSSPIALGQNVNRAITFNANVLDAVAPIHTRNIVENFTLYQNYPNPFNPVTEIRFDILRAGPTLLTVYDVQGRQVVVLINQTLSAGSHSVQFKAQQLASGMYFYKIESGNFSSIRKMVLLK